MDVVTNKISNAFAIAEDVHRDQVDRAGAPYMAHVFTVAAYAALANGNDPTVVAAALLHDSIEDAAQNGFHPEEIATRIHNEVGADVLDVVRTLTHHPDDSYDEYLAVIEAHPVARKVKLADLTHNMDLSRLTTITELDGQRRNKYLRAFRRLTQAEASSPSA